MELDEKDWPVLGSALARSTSVYRLGKGGRDSAPRSHTPLPASSMASSSSTAASASSMIPQLARSSGLGA
eukprot:84460-Pyramimonas_sp.AAC.1